MRPFGERNRKWERVVWHDQNTYYVTNSDETWLLLTPEDLWPSWAVSQNITRQQLEEDACMLAPVLVERCFDETYQPYTRIRVRNAHHRGMVSASYRNFTDNVLRQLTRNQLYFDRMGTGNSPHYAVYCDNKPHFLPKRRCHSMMRLTTYNYQATPRKVVECGNFLYFREYNGVVELDDDSPKHFVPKKRVDKAAKSIYREHIKDFVEHALSVGTLLHADEYRTHIGHLLSGVRDERGIVAEEALRERIKQIISDPNDDDRMALAGYLLGRAEFFEHKAKWNGYSKERYYWNREDKSYTTEVVQIPPYGEAEQKKAYQTIRRKLNAQLNKMCGFIKEEVEGE